MKVNCPVCGSLVEVEEKRTGGCINCVGGDKCKQSIKHIFNHYVKSEE